MEYYLLKGGVYRSFPWELLQHYAKYCNRIQIFCAMNSTMTVSCFARVCYFTQSHPHRCGIHFIFNKLCFVITWQIWRNCSLLGMCNHFCFGWRLSTTLVRRFAKATILKTPIHKRTPTVNSSQLKLDVFAVDSREYEEMNKCCYWTTISQGLRTKQQRSPQIGSWSQHFWEEELKASNLILWLRSKYSRQLIWVVRWCPNPSKYYQVLRYEWSTRW